MGVGVKWYEWWLVGQAADDYCCYYYWSLPFFASILLPLYFTKIPKFSKLPALPVIPREIRRLEFLFSQNRITGAGTGVIYLPQI